MANFDDRYPLDKWRDADHSVMQEFSLAGKKGFVTGAAGGIGRSAAAAWAEAGADVALVDLPAKLDQLESLAAEMSDKYGVTVVAIGCDVSDPDSVAALKTELVDRLGTVDIAFLNAGVCLTDDSIDIPFDKWQKTLDINLSGAFMTGQIAHQIMREHGHGGSLIFTSSTAGHTVLNMGGFPAPNMSYGVTKAGVTRYTQYLAAALAPYGIRSNAITPGYIWSGIFGDSVSEEGHDAMLQMVPERRFARNDELQGLLVFLASDASAYVTGTDTPIDGGLLVY
ncbi:SDR family oxidoreductase [Bifidobacterium tissieri]|nr:SDR family oxidoreductase [Bifidobacterium tissieri]